MKSRIVLGSCLVALIVLFASMVSAWEWQGTQQYDCEGCCVEGKTFQYHTTIS